MSDAHHPSTGRPGAGAGLRSAPVPYYEEGGITIHHGDCLAVMASMPENSIDTIITDPPYHLTAGKRGGTGVASLNPDSPAGRSRIGTGFMGKAWDGGDVAFRPETWQAALRVAKPGAFLLAFGGTRTWHRLACAIEDAGWELRDTIAYMFGSGFPKSANISKMIDKAAGAERVRVGRRVDVNGVPVGRDFENGKKHEGYQRPWRDKPADEQNTAWDTAPATDAAKLWNGWGTSLKPAFEPVIVAMKPLDGTFAENALKHGVAGLNIDGGRIAGPKPETTRGMGGQNGRYRPLSAQGRILDDGKGRWPANLVLDGEAARLLDEQAGEVGGGDIRGFVGGEREGGFANVGATGGDGKPCGQLYSDRGGPSRFFYTAKASRSDRGHGNTHPTVKPTDLMKYLCKLTATPTGGVVLDPFAGSGTTLVAAREYGRPCIGIELEEDHCRIIVDRLRQRILFGGAA